MSVGAIPVFVAREIVPPSRGEICWPSFWFVFTSDHAQTINVDTYVESRSDGKAAREADTGRHLTRILCGIAAGMLNHAP